MRRKIGIVASAQSCHEAPKIGMTPRHMVFATVKKLLDESRVPLTEIDMVISASCDTIDGRGISNVYTASAMGAHLKEESKVEEGALMHVLAPEDIDIVAIDSPLEIALKPKEERKGDYFDIKYFKVKR